MTDTTETPKRGRKPEPKEAIADRQDKLRKGRESTGLKRCEVWAKPEHHAQIRAYAKALQDPG